MLDELQPYYDSQPFDAEKTRNLRYFFENPYYGYSDAIFLHRMIRHARPRRIIEVGSGYSSCVTLDTNGLFFDNRIACTFVETYPQRLRTLLREDDLGRIEILDRRLQEITLDRFRALEANDILFIDSTHVAKIGSDVNYIFAEILPALCPGVYVHFHDIIYPFEYPKEWIYEGRAWTEAYLLRAFLTFNREYEIVLFNTFLERFRRDHFVRRMPHASRMRAAASGSGVLPLKIDAEGFEKKVISTLRHPVPLISMEFNFPQMHDALMACVSHLETIGGYRFNAAITEPPLKLEHDEWLSGGEIIASIRSAGWQYTELLARLTGC
jgi:predicted O-methyltransferase YrrM